jgi:transposase InsO family protein
VGDITYIWASEGSLYLDLASRKVVGWAVAGHMRAELVCATVLIKALLPRSIDTFRYSPYSSWRRHQKSVSLRPSGARSSHW